MDIKELKKRLGMDSRVQTVKCKCCGKELPSPNMYGKSVESLTPYCAAGTVLLVQWLIHKGWHVTTFEQGGNFLCPDCFKEGTPEYHKSPNCETWCEQAEKWMNENGGKQ